MEPLNLFTLLGFGFVVGLQHAFEADHVAAVSTVISSTRSLRKSSFFGALWGLGHTTTLLLAGLLILLFKIAIPGSVALSFEFVVGIVLAVLGLGVLRNAFHEDVHVHVHTHGSAAHIHPHAHSSGTHDHAHRSFFIGLIHGLAGSAALMLLVLATVDSAAKGLLYILVFGLGSVVGMVIMGSLIALPFLLTSRFGIVSKAVKLVAGSASVLIGAAIMYEVGFAQGLLLSLLS